MTDREMETLKELGREMADARTEAEMLEALRAIRAVSKGIETE